MVVEHAHGLRQRRGPNAKSSLHKAHLAPDAGLQAPGASLSFAQGSHRSEEHTSELQSLMRISYAVFCLKKKKKPKIPTIHLEINSTTNMRHVTRHTEQYSTVHQQTDQD